MRRHVMSRTVIAGLIAAVLAVGCQQSPPPGKPLVMASFYPLYEFSRRVAGEHADVVSLVPPGVEPHDWEPSPQNVVEAKRAALFVYNGAGFDSWAEKLITDAGGGRAVVVNATSGIELVRAGGRVDPHVWLDPVLAQKQVDAIRAGLSRADPRNAAAYDDNARAFAEQLARVDQRFATGLRQCRRRDVVTSHAAFGYLTRRYGLTQVAVMGLAPESEPSPAELASIARLARERQVTYVFFETLVSPRLAEALAREVGAGTLVLNPIEGITKEEAAADKGYVALMQENLDNLRTGLECP
jgi:zinc transport system substrate-binding protein